MNILYTYGTLRPGNEDNIVLLPGLLYDLGWFPGIKLNPDSDKTVVAERIIINDWNKVDAYEGYRQDDIPNSLFVRKPFLDGYVYEYNRPVCNSHRAIESGDWLEYTQEKRGHNDDRNF